MFNPHDFYSHAIELGGFSSLYPEAKKRTIISRMYYATFLMIRDLLKNKLQSTPVKSQFDALYTDPFMHGLILDTLLIADLNARDLLHKLRGKRNDADYRLIIRNLDKEVEFASQVTRELIVNVFPTLSAKFGQHLNAIQDKVELWFARKTSRYI